MSVAGFDGHIIVADVPLKVKSPNFKREHWAAKSRRAITERRITECCLAADKESTHFRERAQDKRSNFCVLFERLMGKGEKRFDDDNLRGAFKHVRDGVQDFLKIDDRSPRYIFDYEQVRDRNNGPAVRITIWENKWFAA